MKYRSRFATALLTVAACAPLFGNEELARETEPSVRLTVEVEGLRSAKGSVALALFDDPESFDSRSHPVRACRAPGSSRPHRSTAAAWP